MASSIDDSKEFRHEPTTDAPTSVEEDVDDADDAECDIINGVGNGALLPIPETYSKEWDLQVT